MADPTVDPAQLALMMSGLTPDSGMVVPGVSLGQRQFSLQPGALEQFLAASLQSGLLPQPGGEMGPQVAQPQMPSTYPPQGALTGQLPEGYNQQAREFAGRDVPEPDPLTQQALMLAMNLGATGRGGDPGQSGTMNLIDQLMAQQQALGGPPPTSYADILGMLLMKGASGGTTGVREVDLANDALRKMGATMLIPGAQKQQAWASKQKALADAWKSVDTMSQIERRNAQNRRDETEVAMAPLKAADKRLAMMQKAAVTRYLGGAEYLQQAKIIEARIGLQDAILKNEQATSQAIHGADIPVDERKMFEKSAFAQRMVRNVINSFINLKQALPPSKSVGAATAWLQTKEGAEGLLNYAPAVGPTIARFLGLSSHDPRVVDFVNSWRILIGNQKTLQELPDSNASDLDAKNTLLSLGQPTANDQIFINQMVGTYNRLSEGQRERSRTLQEAGSKAGIPFRKFNGFMGFNGERAEAPDILSVMMPSDGKWQIQINNETPAQPPRGTAPAQGNEDRQRNTSVRPQSSPSKSAAPNIPSLGTAPTPGTYRVVIDPSAPGGFRKEPVTAP